jgi:hypothetical protein
MWTMERVCDQLIGRRIFSQLREVSELAELARSGRAGEKGESGLKGHGFLIGDQVCLRSGA